MNPAKFIFESLKGVHFETMLLEACNWSEERASFVKRHLEQYFESLVAEGGSKNTLGLRARIEKDLLDHLDRKEVDACLHIINQLASSTGEKSEARSYEN